MGVEDHVNYETINAGGRSVHRFKVDEAHREVICTFDHGESNNAIPEIFTRLMNLAF